jgi:C1A family cysteine protease
MGQYWSTQQRPKYGWKRPAVPHKNKLKLLAIKDDLPNSFDLNDKMPPVYNQLDLGSCTSNATDAAFAVAINNCGIKDKSGRSRLFTYFNARTIDGSIHEDSGTTIDATIEGIQKKGACSETLYPYYSQYFANLPPAKCYEEGKAYSNISAHQVDQTQIQIEHAIYQGYPVIFGMTVYSAFETEAVASTGVVPMPKEGEAVLGGHAMVIIGYNKETRLFTCRNSWSSTWGKSGNCFIPYDYLLNENLACEFWVITSLNCS